MAHPKLAVYGHVTTLQNLGISIPRAMAGTDLPADPDPLESGPKGPNTVQHLPNFWEESRICREKEMRLAAKVQVFSDRLKAGDPALCEEHERAYRIVMVEGQASGSALRWRSIALAAEGFDCRIHCAMLDKMHEKNAPVPRNGCDLTGSADLSTQHASGQEMIEEFALRVEEFEAQQRATAAAVAAAVEEPSPHSVEDAVEAFERPPDTPPARLLGVAQQLRAETRKLTERGGQFVQENKALVALGAAGLVGSAVGLLVAGGTGRGGIPVNFLATFGL
eukprot:s3967_g3.t1